MSVKVKRELKASMLRCLKILDEESDDPFDEFQNTFSSNFVRYPSIGSDPGKFGCLNVEVAKACLQLELKSEVTLKKPKSIKRKLNIIVFEMCLDCVCQKCSRRKKLKHIENVRKLLKSWDSDVEKS